MAVAHASESCCMANDVQESHGEEELLWTTPIRLLQVTSMPNAALVARNALHLSPCSTKSLTSGRADIGRAHDVQSCATQGLHCS